jgi:uncharacterized protein YbaR (Trm112 family)
MPPETKKTSLDNLKQWREALACPVCFGSLHFQEATVVCGGCGRAYPIVDGIAVLIPQRADRPTTE